ncbi:tRNA uridine(34) acetyltransferase [subsurface metagenome]
MVLINTEELIIKRAYEKNAFTPKSFFKVKMGVLGEVREPIPKKSELLAAYRSLVKKGEVEKNERLEKLLRLHKIRTLSGVAIVAVLTKPTYCPGECIYCPTEYEMPKSYLSDEPAVMRAIRSDFDPERQVSLRLEALEKTGHFTDKIEIIILGGTFTAFKKEYQKYFIWKTFDALNKKSSKNIEEAIKLNETAKHRCVGLTIETRPDLLDENEIIRLRNLGVTRVEIGVQSVYDDILKLVKRGHTQKEIIYATKLLKDAGIKVNYHMMPNLPGSNIKKDIEMFKILFENSNYKPDQLKIYPCVVVRESELYDWWKNKKFIPYKKDELISLLMEVKKNIPKYVRISRLFRDIPSTRIETGVKSTNLRQMVKAEMLKRGLSCSCIRCREVREKLVEEEFKKPVLFRQDYNASEGKEIFLSFEDEKREKLFAFIRLRIPSYFSKGETHYISELENAAIVREVHTYGEVVPIGKRGVGVQHRGLGKRLMKKAEKIAKNEFGVKKIAVTSGIGVRPYYYKLGYNLEGTYMIKNL